MDDTVRDIISPGTHKAFVRFVDDRKGKISNVSIMKTLVIVWAKRLRILFHNIKAAFILLHLMTVQYSVIGHNPVHLLLKNRKVLE